MVLPTPLQAFSGMPKASATTEKQTIVDGEKMTGAEALVRSLEDLGVKDVFGVPGGAILPVYDSIKDDTKFRFVLMRHEQAAGHAAEGYALTTGQVGVCIVTSGPGATNMITPIADANMDSIPMVVITGQVGVNAIGTDAFQEADIVGATYPVVKHSYLVTRAQEQCDLWCDLCVFPFCLPPISPLRLSSAFQPISAAASCALRLLLPVPTPMTSPPSPRIARAVNSSAYSGPATDVW
jgi:hypothetical protein